MGFSIEHSEEPHTPPLEGKHVLVTRMHEVDCSLTQQLQKAGARVSHLPLVDIRPLPLHLSSLEGYDWIFWTSQQAVPPLTSLLVAEKQAGRPLPKLGAVGAETAKSLEVQGIPVDFFPPHFHAKAAAETFVQQYSPQGLRILWPCGNLSSPTFLNILKEAGAIVDAKQVYETCFLQPTSTDPGLQALQSGTADCVIFTSPSAVKAFSQSLPKRQTDCTYASIGPSTSQAIIALLNQTPAVEASPHTFSGIVEALCTYYHYQKRLP